MLRFCLRLGRALTAAATLVLLPVPASAQSIRHGDLVITAPWTREPPKGARVAGGFMRITNTGSSPDRLLGGAAPFAKRFEVHEMAVEGGVMRMRELAGGLEIKPGETIELRPGGLHVMYLDITEAPLAGRQVKTVLRFERAGAIEIDMTVEAPAAGAPSGGHKH
jgi:copper(I)-binding protein